MNRQAWIAWLMILLQAWLFWYFSETAVFPLFAIALSLPAMLPRRWILPQDFLPWLDLSLGLLCLLKWNLAPYEPPTMTGFVSYPLMHAAAQFFVLIQITRLWARHPSRPMSVYLPLLAVLVFICLGDVQTSKYGRMRRYYQHATLSLVGLSCLYYSLARRRQEVPAEALRWVRPTASFVILATCAYTARAGNAWVLERWATIEQLLNRAAGARLPSERRNLFVGFSGQAPLGSVQLLRSHLSEEIALRVTSDRPPGYLRGAVFERYTPHGWEWHSDWMPMSHTRRPLPVEERVVQPLPPNVPKQPQFLLRAHDPDQLRPVTIWRTPAVERFTFLPLSTSRLDASAELLFVDRHAVVAGENLPAGVSVTAWVPRQAGIDQSEPIVQPLNWQPGLPLELTQREKLQGYVGLRQVPDRSVNPAVKQLAARIFAGCKTPLQKIEAVQRHFERFKYSLEVHVPQRTDPMTYFLLEEPAAHCEFFASATALLLRIAGVPCRYVTGYAGAEYNAIGRYWIVRQRDAHAWVEAYVPEHGWVVVDCTPAAAVPTVRESATFWMLLDDLSLRSQMIRSALAQPGTSGKLLAAKLFLLTLLTTVPGWLLTGGILFLIARKLKIAGKVKRPVRWDPAIVELRGLLEELDRRLRWLRFEREPGETLHQFATRLQVAAATRPNLTEAAEWYRRYAATRYGSLEQAHTAAEALRTDLRRVIERLNHRPASASSTRSAGSGLAT